MHRALLALALAAAPAGAISAEIRSADECRAAVAADAAAAREAASLWTRLGGGAEAELCEALALEAMGATGSAALILTNLAEDPNRALSSELRLAIYEDAARLWLDDGAPGLARAALDNLDRLAPASPDRLTLRARIAAAEADWPAARAALDALVAASPEDARARALRAAALRLSGDAPAAVAEAEAALALVPDLPEGLFEAAAAEAEAGDASAAEALWLRLIATHPDHELATLARRNLAALDREGLADRENLTSGREPRSLTR